MCSAIAIDGAFSVGFFTVKAYSRILFGLLSAFFNQCIDAITLPVASTCRVQRYDKDKLMAHQKTLLKFQTAILMAVV